MSTTILFALGTVGAAVGRGSVGAAVGCVGAGDGAGGTEGRPVGSSEGPSVEKTVGMSAVGGAEGLDDGKNALGVDVAFPAEPEAVLLGAAVLGATASGAYADVEKAMAAMTRLGDVIRPDPALRAFHDAKYRCFHKLQATQSEMKATMGDIQ